MISLRKKFSLLALSLLFASAANAQIRQYVGIVRGQFSSDFVKNMEACREELRGKGYVSFANTIDSYLKGGFGSGFVYAAEDGTKYVITNLHVMMEADEASITFENQDGTSETRKGLKTFAVNDALDIALLVFPKIEGGGIAEAFRSQKAL